MTLNISRRRCLSLLTGGVASTLLTARALPAASAALQKKIPSSGEALPAIGMGTWQTFNVGNDPRLLDERTRVLREFFAYGGGMVDCSPMYGSSANTLGYALRQLRAPERLFAAEKVWTRDGDDTRKQINEQARAWNLRRLDLVQIHNLLNWREHLANLRELKAAGEIRYIGVTTSHGHRHEELLQILSSQKIDFVQLTYNLTHREAERRLLPLALEHGIAVIANRPYDGGHLIKSLKLRHRVPQWATEELVCNTWADFLLLFIVSHPAVTCAIPATTRTDHMQENMQAGLRPLPNESQRARMARSLERL